MPGIHKEEFVGIMNRLKCYPSVFIETGTWKGDTTKAAIACQMFKTVKSIELDERLFRNNCYPMEMCPKWTGSWLEHSVNNLTLYCGNSADLLPKISPAESSFFFLDAHWWKELSDITKDTPLPLWTELQYIASRNKQEIVVVDDIQAFGGIDHRTVTSDWEKVTVENILNTLPNCLYHFVQNNRLHMRLEER